MARSDASSRELMLSLISHTNVGKTALARTLLRKDIGEVADSAHVTEIPEAHTLIADGDYVVKLWDTPGFGANLAKLAKRLRKDKNPVGWLLHQVWDRVGDRSLFCSQEAVRHVQTDADVVLYLIDASQPPDALAYVDLEIEVIEWIGKPVLVFLNQVGEPDPDRDRANEDEWRDHLSRYEIVRHVDTLDAFTRCWTEEHHILEQAAKVVEGDAKKTAQKLTRVWIERNLDLFSKSVESMADLACFALTDTEELPSKSLSEKLFSLVKSNERNAELERVQRSMYARLAERTQDSMNELIDLAGIEGKTATELAATTKEAFSVKRDVEESLATAIGGAVSGLITGVGADLVSGGLGFGSGAVVGMVLGGAASYAMTRGYNLAQTGKNEARWTQNHFIEQTKVILMLYLAVSHYGRGRGTWQDPVSNPGALGKFRR
ncbi:MAG: DUF3482 domain-containing protein [Verrucomicrobiota bacterium]